MARLSNRTQDLHASPVREMLEVALRPQVISFAGGLPAAETFAGLEAPSPPPELMSGSSSIELPASADIEGTRIVWPSVTRNCFPPALITACDMLITS